MAEKRKPWKNDVVMLDVKKVVADANVDRLAKDPSATMIEMPAYVPPTPEQRAEAKKAAAERDRVLAEQTSERIRRQSAHKPNPKNFERIMDVGELAGNEEAKEQPEKEKRDAGFLTKLKRFFGGK